MRAARPAPRRRRRAVAGRGRPPGGRGGAAAAMLVPGPGGAEPHMGRCLAGGGAEVVSAERLPAPARRSARSASRPDGGGACCSSPRCPQVSGAARRLARPGPARSVSPCGSGCRRGGGVPAPLTARPVPRSARRCRPPPRAAEGRGGGERGGRGLGPWLWGEGAGVRPAHPHPRGGDAGAARCGAVGLAAGGERLLTLLRLSGAGGHVRAEALGRPGGGRQGPAPLRAAGRWPRPSGSRRPSGRTLRPALARRESGAGAAAGGLRVPPREAAR